ncbi:MAG: glycosyltransferase family 4 protein, partial [Thermoanaerobaculia bacterium]
MRRLAYVSPLPPLASGIADYSAELLPHLARHCAVEVFAEPGPRPPRALIEALPPVQPLADLPARAADFDAVLYQLGNNGDFHAGAYRALFTTPGIVVLHELVLHHMVRELTLVAGDRDAYFDEVRYCCGRSGWLLAKRSLDTGTGLDVWSYPLFERVVDASLGVLVHSAGSRQRVLASRPRAQAHAVPFPWSGAGDTAAADAAALRARLGLPPDALLIAAFGYMTRAKRLDVALRAFARIAPRHPQAVFVVAGEVAKDYDVATLVPEELRPRIVFTGRTPPADFLGLMAAANLAVNLRWPSAGETSATLIRLLGMGRPVVVTDAGSFAELPGGTCAKVPPDQAEEELLAAYLDALAADPALRRAMGEAARRHVEAHHRVEVTAAAYAAAVEAILAAGTRPVPAVPPLAPYPPEDVLSDLIAEATADAVDLGAGEDEDELLRGLAEDLAG